MKLSCIVCGSSDFEAKYRNVPDYEYATYHPVNFVMCRRCGLLVQDPPVPSIREIPLFYPSNYRNHLYFNHNNIYSIMKRLQVYSLSGNISHFLTDKKAAILEIGCGSGMLLFMLQKRGFTNLWGNDFSDAPERELSERGILFKKADLDKKFPMDRRFDMIILNHVIEHLRNPKFVLKSCREHLSPGGKIIVMTPNAASIPSLLFKSKWDGINAPRHFFIFNFRSMDKLKKVLGFQKMTFYPMIDPIMWAISLQNQFQSISPLRTKLNHGLAWYTLFLGLLFTPLSLLTMIGKKSASMMCVFE